MNTKQKENMIGELEELLEMMFQWENLEKEEIAKEIIKYLEIKYFDATPAYNPDAVFIPDAMNQIIQILIVNKFTIEELENIESEIFKLRRYLGEGNVDQARTMVWNEFMKTVDTDKRELLGRVYTRLSEMNNWW